MRRKISVRAFWCASAAHGNLGSGCGQKTPPVHEVAGSARGCVGRAGRAQLEGVRRGLYVWCWTVTEFSSRGSFTRPKRWWPTRAAPAPGRRSSTLSSAARAATATCPRSCPFWLQPRPTPSSRTRRGRLRSARRWACLPVTTRSRPTCTIPSADMKRILLGLSGPKRTDVTFREGRDGLDSDEVGGACNHTRPAGSGRRTSPGGGWIRRPPAGWFLRTTKQPTTCPSSHLHEDRGRGADMRPMVPDRCGRIACRVTGLHGSRSQSVDPSFGGPSSAFGGSRGDTDFNRY